MIKVMVMFMTMMITTAMTKLMMKTTIIMTMGMTITIMLTRRGLKTSYGEIDPSRHCSTLLCRSWRHQTITWTNVDRLTSRPVVFSWEQWHRNYSRDHSPTSKCCFKGPMTLAIAPFFKAPTHNKNHNTSQRSANLGYLVWVGSHLKCPPLLLTC